MFNHNKKPPLNISTKITALDEILKELSHAAEEEIEFKLKSIAYQAISEQRLKIIDEVMQKFRQNVTAAVFRMPDSDDLNVRITSINYEDKEK